MKKFIILGVMMVLILTSLFFYKKSDKPLPVFISSVLPFGSGENVNIPANTQDNTVSSSTPTSATSSQQTVVATKLFHIFDEPVAGFVPLIINKTNVVRYTERGTGHIYDALLPSDESEVEKTQITNNTLPKIYNAVFESDGKKVLYQSVDDQTDTMVNMTLTLTPPNPKNASSSTLYSVSATNLRGAMDEVKTFGGDSLIYVLRDNSSVNSSSFTGEGIKTLYSSIFYNWRVFKLGSGVGLYTKASADVAGFAYRLSGGVLNKLLGPLNGLNVISNNDGTRLIYSYNDNGTIKLFYKDIAKNNSVEILPSTFAEKCISSLSKSHIIYCAVPRVELSGNEPDNWYKGISSTSDYLWKYDADTNMSNFLVDPKEEFGVDIDVTNLQLTPDESFLIFMNKKDLSLWALRLK